MNESGPEPIQQFPELKRTEHLSGIRPGTARPPGTRLAVLSGPSRAFPALHRSDRAG